MNDEKTIQAVIDAARAERKKNRRAYAAFAASIFILCGAMVYFATHYQAKTACSVDPSSKECQHIRADGAKAQNTRVACIAFRQVGYVCPAPRKVHKILRHFKTHKPIKPVKKDKSNGPSSDQPSGAQPSSGAGGSTSGGDGSGGGSDGSVGDSPEGPDPSPGPTPTPNPPPTPEPPPTPPPTPDPEPNPGTVGKGVDDVVNGAGEVVQGTTGAVCHTVGVCLPSG